MWHSWWGCCLPGSETWDQSWSQVRSMCGLDVHPSLGWVSSGGSSSPFHPKDVQDGRLTACCELGLGCGWVIDSRNLCRIKWDQCKWGDDCQYRHGGPKDLFTICLTSWTRLLLLSASHWCTNGCWNFCRVDGYPMAQLWHRNRMVGQAWPKREWAFLFRLG